MPISDLKRDESRELEVYISALDNEKDHLNRRYVEEKSKREIFIWTLMFISLPLSFSEFIILSLNFHITTSII